MSTYPIPMSPVVNAGLLYINGLNLSFVSGTAISIAAGQCRDARNINDILSPVLPAPPFDAFDQNSLAHGAINSALLSVPQPIAVLTTFVGAGGLDTGTVGNNKLYAVYVIGSSAGSDQSSSNDYVATSGILSLDASQPILPVGYDMFRRIGYVLTSGAGAILEFAQTGSGSSRWMLYGAPVITDVVHALDAGTSAVVGAPGAINMRSSTYLSIPAAAVMVRVQALLNADDAGDSVSLHPHGAADASNYAIFASPVASVAVNGNIDCPCDSAGKMDYFMTSADDGISLYVQGYQDAL